jgi:CHAT domain-containing protein
MHVTERFRRVNFGRLEIQDGIAYRSNFGTQRQSDDLRHALFDDTYQILHFSGHGGFNTLLFENERSNAVKSPLEAIVSLIDHHPSIRCVILNACNSVAALGQAIADLAIGVDQTIDDDAAIQLAQGFYDGDAAGKSYEFAIEEGRISCVAKKLIVPLKVLTR